MLVEVVITFSCLLLSFVKGSESRLCSGPVCIPSDYNKLDPPKKYQNRIYIWFPYIEVQKVDEDSGTITLTMKLATSWEEPRLNASWNKYLYYNKNYGTPLDEAFTEKLWMPDLFLHSSIPPLFQEPSFRDRNRNRNSNGLVSKTEQVQEQQWVRNAKRSVTGTVKGT